MARNTTPKKPTQKPEDTATQQDQLAATMLQRIQEQRARGGGSMRLNDLFRGGDVDAVSGDELAKMVANAEEAGLVEGQYSETPGDARMYVRTSDGGYLVGVTVHA